MSEEQRRPGRPRKHPAEEFHFRAAEPEEQVEDVVVEEIPKSDIPVVEGSFVEKESPMQQKIHELLEDKQEAKRENIAAWNAEGWRVISNPFGKGPPLNGNPVFISERSEGQGVLAFWKKTRAFANMIKRWEYTGIWCDYLTGIPINFEPKYWRERS